DSALVHHYFGSKKQLFVAAMELPVEFTTAVPRLLDGPEARIGERFVEFVLDLWDRVEIRPLLLGLVRSATTDQVAAGMLPRQRPTRWPPAGSGGWWGGGGGGRRRPPSSGGAGAARTRPARIRPAPRARPGQARPGPTPGSGRRSPAPSSSACCSSGSWSASS